LAQGILSYFTTHEAIDPKLYQEDLLLKELEVGTVLVKSIPDPDTLYLMCAPDVAQFKEALKKEGSKHTRKGHWEIHRRTEVPSHSKILLAFWSKTRIDLREVSKHKTQTGVQAPQWDILPGGKMDIHPSNGHSFSNKWMVHMIVMGYSEADISTNHVYIEFSNRFEFGGAEIPTVCM
jgi:hypothetical protein